MNRDINKTAIWTLVANLFIIIATGHGIAPLALLEISATFNPHAFAERLSFSLHDTYDHHLLTVVLFSVIGQLLMLSALWIKKVKPKRKLLVSSLTGLYVGLLYLTINLKDGDTSLMGLITAIPFIVLSIGLLLILYSKITRQIENI